MFLVDLFEVGAGLNQDHSGCRMIEVGRPRQGRLPASVQGRPPASVLEVGVGTTPKKGLQGMLCIILPEALR